MITPAFLPLLTTAASLCADIIRSYTLLDEETQQRNIVAWRPVVIDTLEGFTNFPRDSFDQHVEVFYPLAVGLMEKELNTEMKGALCGLFRRVGEIRMGMQEGEGIRTPGLTPTTSNASPGTEKARFDWSRRSSRAGR
jgi:brefeldin A-inhibited guanine nucleotide-exchange protein